MKKDAPPSLQEIEQSPVSATLSEPLQVLVGEFPADRVGGRRFHFHSALEIGVVIRGSTRRRYTDCSVTLSPGEVWWAGCLEPHASVLLGERLTTVGFIFRPEAIGGDPFGEVDWLAPFLVAPRERPQPLPRDRQEVLRIAQSAMMLAQKRPPAWRVAAWLQLHQLVWLICSSWRPSIPRRREQFPAETVAPALRLVRDRPTHPVRLAEAAQACSMSRTRFASAFASTMGISFAKFALRTRLAAAAGDLSSGTDGIKRLAARWGFTDASHFHHVFRQHYGCTPSEFRAGRPPEARRPH